MQINILLQSPSSGKWKWWKVCFWIFLHTLTLFELHKAYQWEFFYWNEYSWSYVKHFLYSGITEL